MLTIFNQPLTRFGLGCAGALLAGLLACLIVLKRNRRPYGDWIRLCVCVIPLTWLFARLLFALADWIMIPLEGFFDLDTGRDPLNGFRFWLGGYSLMGGVLGAVLGAMLAEKWTHDGREGMRHALAFGVPVGILAERLLEHGTGLGLGRYVTVSWLIGTGLCPELDGDYVHPVYLYEALAALILLLIVWLLFRKGKLRGALLLESFLLLFGLSQVILESLRADGHMVEHFVHVQQVYAILFAAAVILRWTLAMKPKQALRITLSWIAVFAAVGVAVWAEFGVDRWGNPLLAYGIMIACMAAIGTTGFLTRPGKGRTGANAGE